MNSFFGTPIYLSQEQAIGSGWLVKFTAKNMDFVKMKTALQNNKIVLISAVDLNLSGLIFGKFVDHFNLRDSYDLQMQVVGQAMASRTPVDDMAVSVSKRGEHKLIQAHSEGDTTSPLDLFGLYCKDNSPEGGESLFSMADQHVDHSRLRAKEKVIIGENLANAELHQLRLEHRDALKVDFEHHADDKVVQTIGRGSVVIRQFAVAPSQSIISGENLVTYWDNVTVHDHAFHEYHYELLKNFDLLCHRLGTDYQSYMHVGSYSDWAPADTKSGNVEQTSELFACHVSLKLDSGDLCFLNNKAWTHAANNWPSEQHRNIVAMYA
jgi:hypothetical protein